MKPNDSQMHSHFGNCTHAGVANVQGFGWKEKNNTKLGLQDTIRKVLKHRCLKNLHIVHLDLICMNYDQRRGGNQIGNLTPDHKSFKSKGQMKSNWNMLHTVGKIFSKAIKYFPCTLKKILLGQQDSQFWDSHLGVLGKSDIWMQSP